MLLSIFGCVAAFIENKPVILSYYICVLVVFIALCICIMLGYIYRMHVNVHLRSELRLTAVDYDPDSPSDPITKAWDDMQKNLKCCGVARVENDGTTAEKAWRVWLNNKKLNSGGAEQRVPDSCCLVTSSNGKLSNCNDGDRVNEELVNKDDCFESGTEFLHGHVEMLGVCFIVFGVVLILAAVLAICLYHLAD